MVLVGMGFLMMISPEFAHAQFAGGLESKVQGVTMGSLTFCFQLQRSWACVRRHFSSNG